ncbi:MAG: hypothetical protein IH624_14895 [Phycisphaerae bacterium]|nr:hypothetical protein [Phycisphaerae bacterium]
MMRVPEVQNPDRYVGLFVVDFGDHTGLGFTADEVAELLDSEKFRDVRVYKIHNAYPDGRMELKGVRRELFEAEAGMFFYAPDEATARDDYKRLVGMAVTDLPPERAKVHLARHADGRWVTAMIYPAECDDEFSRWLLARGYRTAGEVEGGIDAVSRYYSDAPEVVERHQLFGTSSFESRTGEALLAATQVAVQR